MNLSPLQLEKLRNLGVSLIYLFGSYAEGKEGPLSDIDLAVLFHQESVPGEENIGGAYNALYDILTDLFPRKNVDIIFLQKTNLELRFDVITHGKILYESSREDRRSFEEKTTLLYADFKPLLKLFNQTLLHRA